MAYFQKYTGNADSGKSLAAAVLYTAQAQGLENPDADQSQGE